MAGLTSVNVAESNCLFSRLSKTGRTARRSLSEETFDETGAFGRDDRLLRSMSAPIDGKLFIRASKQNLPNHGTHIPLMVSRPDDFRRYNPEDRRHQPSGIPARQSPVWFIRHCVGASTQTDQAKRSSVIMV
jgi:hypothetical protein